MTNMFYLIFSTTILYGSLCYLLIHDSIDKAVSELDDAPLGPDDVKYLSFRTPLLATFTCLQVILLNGWSDIYWTAIAGAEISNKDKNFVAFLLVIWLFLGSFLLGNMAIGIMIESMGTNNDKKLLEDVKSDSHQGTHFSKARTDVRYKCTFKYQDGDEPPKWWRFMRKIPATGSELHEFQIEDIRSDLIDTIAKRVLRCTGACGGTINDVDASECKSCGEKLSATVHYGYSGFLGEQVWEDIKGSLDCWGSDRDEHEGFDKLQQHLLALDELVKGKLAGLPHHLKETAGILKDDIQYLWAGKDLDQIDDTKWSVD